MVFLRVVTGCLLATMLASSATGCAESAPVASGFERSASGLICLALFLELSARLRKQALAML